MAGLNFEFFDSTPPELLGSVRAFYADVRDQLAATPHFGVLGELLESDPAATTRLDYVHRNCILLHRLKTSVPGIGLGSSNNFPAQGTDDNNEWKSVRKMTALEVCQSWAVLLNAGHLFGTFATERPLLFELDRSLPLRDAFVEAICKLDVAKGNPLRSRIPMMLDQARLHSLHTLLALWRLREGGPSKLAGEDLKKARLLVKAYLLPPTEKIKSLVSVFKRVRQLSYLQLHASLQSTPYSLVKLREADLRTLFPEDSIPEADWDASASWGVIEALDRYDAETLFGSSQAAARVLQHVAEFREWWNRSTLAVDARLDALFVQPQDWPQATPSRLDHFIELRVPSTLGWLHEVRHWLRDDREENPWRQSDFVITPSVRDASLRVDLYAPPEGIATHTLEHVIRQMARPFSGGAEIRQQHALWMSMSRLAARSFEAMLAPQHHLRLRPVSAIPEHAGYATAGATYEFVRGRVKGFLPLTNDQQRSNELRRLLAVADEVVGWRNAAFVVLARAEVMFASNDRSDARTDLDGVLGFFRDDALHWLIVETKRSERVDGERQLMENLFPALAQVPTTRVETRSFGRDQAWFVVLTSPPRLSIPAWRRARQAV